MSETLLLPAQLDLKAAESLKADILVRRGKDLTLDGSAVERLGGLGLQVLLAARKTWAAACASRSCCRPARPGRRTVST